MCPQVNCEGFGAEAEPYSFLFYLPSQAQLLALMLDAVIPM
jgi:hypothetical protein